MYLAAKKQSHGQLATKSRAVAGGRTLPTSARSSRFRKRLGPAESAAPGSLFPRNPNCQSRSAAGTTRSRCNPDGSVLPRSCRHESSPSPNHPAPDRPRPYRRPGESARSRPTEPNLFRDLFALRVCAELKPVRQRAVKSRSRAERTRSRRPGQTVTIVKLLVLNGRNQDTTRPMGPPDI